MRRAFCLIGLSFCLTACGTYAVSVVKPPSFDPKATVSHEAPKKDAALVIVSDDDITDRPYRVLGDIEIHVNKITTLDANPTCEKVRHALREKGAEIGADAVVLVRCGVVIASYWTPGGMDGRGRAIIFNN